MTPDMPRSRWWWRPLCWLLGHDLNVIRSNPHKALAFMGQYPLPGKDAICRRCRRVWADAMNGPTCPVCGAPSWEHCKGH
jgi:rRNA maturation endonuclease Nob1